MDPASAAATIDALNQGINVVSQQNINRRNRKYAEKMYNKQRQDALSDWERQNQYNSPQAQMQRYKDAGLNPNLIYGNQSDGPTVRSTPMDVPEGKAPSVEGNSLLTYQDASLKAVQTNNMRQQADILQAQEELIKAQTIATYMSADKTSLSNQFTRDAYEANLNKLLLGNQLTGVNIAKGQTDIAGKTQDIAQKAEIFPLVFAEKLTNILRMEKGMELTDAQIKGIAQQVKNGISQNSMREAQKIGVDNLNSVWSDVHELMLLDKGLKEGKRTQQEVETEGKRITNKWKGYGLSDTFISDILGTLAAGLGIGKMIQKIAPGALPKNPHTGPAYPNMPQLPKGGKGPNRRGYGMTLPRRRID